MNKTLCFSFDDKDYTLEFTRRTVQEMEKRGFVISEIENKPISLLPAMFAGAFLAHHRFVKQEVIDEIFSKLTDKETLINKLAEMYHDPFITLIEEPKDSPGNVEWTANW